MRNILVNIFSRSTPQNCKNSASLLTPLEQEQQAPESPSKSHNFERDKEVSLPSSPIQIFHTPPTSRPSSGSTQPSSTKYYLHDLLDTMHLHLLECSPSSKEYSTQLRLAIDSVATNLTEHDRTAESHAIRQLYLQSFKDPGSAELLDALLRNRANERQRIDFERYVDDVNSLQQVENWNMPPKERKRKAEDELNPIEEGTQVVENDLNKAQNHHKRLKGQDEKWIQNLTGEIRCLREEQQEQLRIIQQELPFPAFTGIHSKKRRMTKMFHGANGPVYSRKMIV